MEECVVAGLWWTVVVDHCALSTLNDDPGGKVLSVSLRSPGLHSKDGVLDKDLVSICSVMPEELVPCKG